MEWMNRALPWKQATKQDTVIKTFQHCVQTLCLWVQKSFSCQNYVNSEQAENKSQDKEKSSLICILQFIKG